MLGYAVYGVTDLTPQPVYKTFSVGLPATELHFKADCFYLQYTVSLALEFVQS